MAGQWPATSRRSMLVRIGLVLAAALPGAVGVAPAHADAEADAFLRMVEDRTRADTNIATYRMEVVRPDFTRSFRMRSWDDRVGERSFIHILEPRRDQDTTFLKVEGNLWMYLPNLEREIRIPPALMLNSWMGSDFTNDDLVRESSMVNDYENVILARAAGADGIEVVTVRSVPRPNAPVVWGKVVQRVRADGVPIAQEFYDDRGALVRTMRFENVRELGGRLLPTHMVMIPAKDPGHSTVLDIEEAAFDVAIPETVFSRANLSRRR